MDEEIEIINTNTRVEKLKKFKNNFPILVGNKAISNHFCTSLIKEISSSETFDDLIMGGRSRINKGSKNFKKYIFVGSFLILLVLRWLS